jgi:hypothetical protein
MAYSFLIEGLARGQPDNTPLQAYKMSTAKESKTAEGLRETGLANGAASVSGCFSVEA